MFIAIIAIPVLDFDVLSSPVGPVHLEDNKVVVSQI